MAYVAAPDCRSLYLTTPRQTRKFRNLMENPGVSILIDTRCTDPLENVRALTISGIAAEVIDPWLRKTVRGLFVEMHPQLADFVDAPGSVFIVVTISSFQLLEGVQRASYIRLDEVDDSVDRTGGGA
jgi:hypothetical protein